MSSATASPPGNTPKAMSSRLLTMKFMQRAAASTSTATPSTPEEPSPKRRKKESDSPSRPESNIDKLADQRAVQAAIAAEEAKRQVALDKQGVEAGDTRWVLSFEDQKGSIAASTLAIRVVQAGYAHLDVPQPTVNRSVEEDPWEEKSAMVGRRSFGRFNKILEKQLDPTMEDSSESESESEEDENEDSEESSSDDDDPAGDLIRASRQEAAERAKAERKSKKKAEKAHLLELARQRKKKEVNLNGMTSLSGRQTNGPTCYNCGGPHVKADCPTLADTRKCYICGGPHLANRCPEKKRHFDGPQGGFAKKART